MIRITETWVLLLALVLVVAPAHSGDSRESRQHRKDPSLRSRMDLTVENVDISRLGGDSRGLGIGGIATVEIANAGEDPADGTITVTIFEDSNFSGRFEAETDNVLGSATLEDLEPGALVSLDVPVIGGLRSRKNWISATVSGGGAVVESDELNNTMLSGTGFRFDRQAEDSFNPVLQWSWTRSSVAPNALNVMTTPAVVDINGDGIPEVIFASTASKAGGMVESGILRALDGNNGEELFSVTEQQYAVNATSSVAVGDLDSDRSPEIVACDRSGRRLIAFDSEGNFRWRSGELEPINWGGPVISDLDGDGTPEIIVGRQVLDNEGAVLWTGEGGRGAGGRNGPLSTVADLDLDGDLEVVAGNTAYDADGTLLWKAPVADGYPTVAEFDGDPFPEIALVSRGKVRVLDHTGSLIWGPVSIPGGGAGGRAVVADLDDDGEPEIGVAGKDRYVVFETDGTVKWEAATQDETSSRTSSAAYDFNRDGLVELVYRDELFLRFFSGLDGTVLFDTPMSSCTWYEHPLVVDVDADGEPEIIAVANDSCGKGSQRGVFVFRDAGNDWRSAE
jgi:hypothetical protein